MFYSYPMEHQFFLFIQNFTRGAKESWENCLKLLTWMNPILKIFRKGGMLLVPLLSYAKAIESSKKSQFCTFACLKAFGLCNCANSQQLDVRQGWKYKPVKVGFSSKKADLVNNNTNLFEDSFSSSCRQLLLGMFYHYLMEHQVFY
ncbi:hypothetical protein ACB098_03G034400 [Castanea mollissima]